MAGEPSLGRLQRHKLINYGANALRLPGSEGREWSRERRGQVDLTAANSHIDININAANMESQLINNSRSGHSTHSNTQRHIPRNM